MEDRRSIIERELQQIEQIRELDYEELQVEEVEDLLDSDDDNDNRLTTGQAYDAGARPGELTFNTSLASLHTYLGEVEDTHNRLAFLDGGAVHHLPLFYFEGVVLFPGATLPLRVVQPNLLATIERALGQIDQGAPLTIGVVRIYRDPDDGRVRFATTGTTAEIRQYRRLEDGSLNAVTRGQQRFRLKRCWIDVEGVVRLTACGEVQIIEEDLPLRTPKDVFDRLAPLNGLANIGISGSLPSGASHVRRHGYQDEDDDSEAHSEDSFQSALSPSEHRLHRSAVDSLSGYEFMDESTSSDEDKFACESEFQSGRSLPSTFGSSHIPNLDDDRMEDAEFVDRSNNPSERRSHKVAKIQPSWKPSGLHRGLSKAFWPHWVYRMYDSYSLAQRAADMWKQIVGAPAMDDFVKKPDLLSFHIASKIPVSESTRQELLEIDGTSYRLRREINLLECFDRIRCKNCQTLIARRSDMLVMSTDGPLGAYVNPHGYVHEIMTLYKANGLVRKGRPATEYSWFPGYAWTIINCATCETQMGWLFTATNEKLKPRMFWGIRSSQVADDMQAS
ncbi:protein cereblon isoform X2 [Punica granatum]|uniref:Protein cereblon n=1 Tax=Punica granatum TaxID=22663 RepID=A0A6P8EJW4_PUNGR|nr:protein cereblon isoform X2 [Punica granatum]